MQTTAALDIPIIEENISREEQADALLAAFFNITDDWQLSNAEAQALLGNPSKTRFYALKKRAGEKSSKRAAKLSDDEFYRLAYISGIYIALNILYSPENARLFLKNTPKGDLSYLFSWGAKAPLRHMIDQPFEGIVDVYRHVNGVRGGI